MRKNILCNWCTLHVGYFSSKWKSNWITYYSLLRSCMLYCQYAMPNTRVLCQLKFRPLHYNCKHSSKLECQHLTAKQNIMGNCITTTMGVFWSLTCCFTMLWDNIKDDQPHPPPVINIETDTTSVRIYDIIRFASQSLQCELWHNASTHLYVATRYASTKSRLRTGFMAR